MELSTMMPALAGGAMCGVAAVGLLLTHGRIAGISGLLGSAASPLPVEARGSRWAFLAGLPLAGALLALTRPEVLAIGTATPLPAILVAGMLVGLGSGLGNGCTSGHGICGLGRMSPRSLVAVSLFGIVGTASLWLTRALIGGASRSAR